MVPLDPRQRATPLNQPSDALPVICGINANDLQPGRRIGGPASPGRPATDRGLRTVADGRVGGLETH